MFGRSLDNSSKTNESKESFFCNDNKNQSVLVQLSIEAVQDLQQCTCVFVGVVGGL